MKTELVINSRLNKNNQLEIPDFETKNKWIDSYLEENPVFIIQSDSELKECKERRATTNKLLEEIKRFRIDNINDVICLFEEQFKILEKKLDDRQKELGKEIEAYTDSKKTVVVKAKHKITATLKFFDENIIKKIEKFAIENGCELKIS